MTLIPVPPGDDHRTMEFRTFDLGLIDNVSPTDWRLAGRAALFCRNMNYDRRTIARRGGIQRVAENAPGAVQIKTFEPAEVWSAVNGAILSADTTLGRFVVREVAGTGTQGRQANMNGSGGTSQGLKTVPGAPLNLSGHAFDVFSVWIWPLALTGTYRLEFVFRTSVGNEYVGVLGASNDRAFAVDVGAYRKVKRYAFTATGTPNWASIAEIELRAVFDGTGGSVVMTFDNLTKNPGRGQDLIQFRRLTDPTWKGAKDEYAVVEGHLYRLDEAAQVWIDMGLLFDPDAEVNHVIFDDRLYLCDGVNPNWKVMPDGTSLFRMGIAAFTAPITTGQVAGGSLADGDHYIVVTYYSTITGIESGIHTPLPGHKQTISGGGGTARISYSGLPASTDPQVTHLRIYRLSPTSSVFRRVSLNPDGEVLNGTGTYLEGVADSQMGDELDPDKDAPKPTKFFTAFKELGVLLAVFTDTPSVVNISSPNDGAGPENWPVELAVAVGRDDNDIVTGLHFDGTRPLVFKPNGVLEGIFVGGEEFVRFRTIRTDRGSMSHKAILSVENRTYYPGSDGIYTLDLGNSVRKATNLQQNTWNELVFRERLHATCATQIRSRYQYLLFFNSKGAAQNNQCWKVHHNSVLVDRSFDKGLGPGHTAATCIDDLGAMASEEVEISGEVRETWILADDGQVYRIDTGSTDDGRPFRARHRTAVLSPTRGKRLHHFPYLDLELRQSSHDAMLVRVWYDYSVGTPADEFIAQLTGDGAEVLGPSTFILGTSHLGASYGHRKQISLGPKNARWIIFEFEQPGYADFEIYEAAISYDVDGQP